MQAGDARAPMQVAEYFIINIKGQKSTQRWNIYNCIASNVLWPPSVQQNYLYIYIYFNYLLMAMVRVFSRAYLIFIIIQYSTSILLFCNWVIGGE